MDIAWLAAVVAFFVGCDLAALLLGRLQSED